MWCSKLGSSGVTVMVSTGSVGRTHTLCPLDEVEKNSMASMNTLNGSMMWGLMWLCC